MNILLSRQNFGGGSIQKKWVKVDKSATARLANAMPSVYSDILLDLLEMINTPKSIAVAICLRNIDQIETCDLKSVLSCDPYLYNDIRSYELDSQAVGLLKKTCMFKRRYDKNLLDFYRTSEETAKAQREIVESLSFSFEERTLINRVAGIIRSIIGALPNSISSRFGPGSTYCQSALDATLFGKLTKIPECTPLCSPILENVMEKRFFHKAAIEYHVNNQKLLFQRGSGRALIFNRSYNETVPGDRFCIVEKDIFKPRAMCPQPGGNMLVQLGLADLLERRFLRKTGIDLSKTDMVHRNIVEHCPDLFGTIDLSNASDSISLALIELLFPRDWYWLIRSITCRQTRVDGTWYPNSKAFAQGCGITFIVECIIFYAIAYASVEKQCVQSDPARLVSVYGDDIIVPVNYTSSVIKDLQTFGFVVNQEKSYGDDSLFKESCGMDSFLGYNVRPIYFKSFRPTLQGITILTNMVTKVILKIKGVWSFERVYHRLKKLYTILGESPLFVPKYFGMDEGIHSDIDHLIKVRHYIHYCKVYEYKKPTIIGSDFVALAATATGNTGSTFTPRSDRILAVRARYRSFSGCIDH